MLYGSKKHWHLKYEEVCNFNEDLCVVKLKDKYGFTDQNGFRVILPKYEGVWYFLTNFGIPMLVRRGKDNLCDWSNFYLEPLETHEWNFNKNMAKVMLKGKWGFVNEKGVEIVPPLYDGVWNFKKDYVVKLNGLYGLLNEKGEEKIPIKYNKQILLELSKAAKLLAFKLKVSPQKAKKILIEEMKEL